MCPEEFIDQHKKRFVNYCEAVILPDGDIQYAVPSHLYKMYLLYGLSETDIYEQTDRYISFTKTIPIISSPVWWMCQDKNIVSVWYNLCVFSMNYTLAQEYAVQKLIQTGCLSNNCEFDCSVEKTLTTERDSLSDVAIEHLMRERNKKLLEFKQSVSKCF